MKIKYWGTAAAEGIPGIFCACPVCVEAREKGGRFVRSRAQVLFDDELLVDFGPDSYSNSLKYGFDLSKLTDLLITHTHMDHYSPFEFLMRLRGFCNPMENECLTIHGSPDIVTVAKTDWQPRGYEFEKVVESGRLAFDVIKPYESREIRGFKVTPLPASHGTENPYVYILEKGGKTMLLHNDSGYLCDEAMEWLRKNEVKFDLVSYDCTYADRDANGGGNHMGIPNNLEAKRRFIENGNYKDSTVSIVTHFSHNSPNVGYNDMLKIAEDNGFIMTYDGYEIEI
jgi:phosphoribosyl 1,2-cyclic phosphate phosphodiesterase